MHARTQARAYTHTHTGGCLGDLYLLDPAGPMPWAWRNLSGPGGPAPRQVLRGHGLEYQPIEKFD